MNALIRAAADLQRVCEHADWVDIEGVLVRQSGVLDWAYVTHHLSQRADLKEAPELVDKLERLRASVDHG